MTDLSRSSSLEDPLHAYSGLSLFPRTLKSLPNPLLPRLYQSDDLQQTHTLLESIPFEIQKEHQAQAKAILDDNSELVNQGIGSSVASEDMNVGVKMNPIQNKRERRPGLDRKRGQFSFKPTTRYSCCSQPPSNEPSFDVSKYPKPEDCFAAYEKFKNAKREWEKQTGISVTDTHQNQPSKRIRRPGIPGRKRGSYTHIYTDSYFTDTINLETSEKENYIPSEKSLERTKAAHVSIANREVDDLAVDTDKDIENILSELLACNEDELKGDGAVRLLEERLQIKPLTVENLTIPEFQDVREMRLKESGRIPSNRKSVLSDIQNMLEGIHSCVVRKTRQSPSNLPVDPFSFPDIQHLLPGDQQPSEVDLAKDLNICSRSPETNDADKDIADTSLYNVDTAYVASPFNGSVRKSSNEDNSHSHSGIHRSRSIPDKNADNCVEGSITNRNPDALEVNVDMQTKGNEGDVTMSESENYADITRETDKLDRLAEYASKEAERIDHFTVEEDNIRYQQDELSKSPSRTQEQCNTMDGSFEHVEVNDNTNITCELQVEKSQEVQNSSHEQSNKRRKRETRDRNNKKKSKTVRGEIEGDNKQVKTLSNESGAKKKTKRKSNEREEKKQMKTVTRESKIFSRRKSLAAAGTKWESGVRRSTRIKSRPLEYWRGERFLFGRIHESLATVIGIKYASPEKCKTNKPASKVKSFVSDDYKELIDFAALH